MTTPPASPVPPQPRIAGAWQPLPSAGAAHAERGNPLFDPFAEPAGRDYKKWAIRIVLVLVMTAALAVGTWSIFTLLTQTLGAPKPIAVFGCGLFDVAALFFALLSQQNATTTDSGLAPRTAMLVMVCTSSWVNWKHAMLENWGIVGGVILAAAPVIAELSFELFHRFEHREALRNLGRVPQALPVLGKWAWLAHPFRSRKTIDAHIKAALTEHEAIAARREEVATVRAQAVTTIPVTVDRPDRTDATGPQWAAEMDRWTGPQLPTDRTALAPAGPVERTAPSGPVNRTADPVERTDGPNHTTTVQRTTTADRTTGPDRTDRALDRTADQSTSGPDRTEPDHTPEDRTTPVQRTADHPDQPPTLTDLERTAIEHLRTTNRSISKRSIQDVIRNELGGSIASDRAVQIARHFRTLRSAA